MKIFFSILFLLSAASAAAASNPFSPLPPDEAYGVGTVTWRFASALLKEASGSIEIGYAEEGATERILGRVEVRPFRSSEKKMPDLRILFAKADVAGSKQVVLIVGYGLRSGTFVADVPGLTTHSLSIAGAPWPDSNGDISLLGYGDGPIIFGQNGMTGEKGRLFLRYRD